MNEEKTDFNLFNLLSIGVNAIKLGISLDEGFRVAGLNLDDYLAYCLGGDSPFLDYHKNKLISEFNEKSLCSEDGSELYVVKRIWCDLDYIDEMRAVITNSLPDSKVIKLVSPMKDIIGYRKEYPGIQIHLVRDVEDVRAIDRTRIIDQSFCYGETYFTPEKARTVDQRTNELIINPTPENYEDYFDFLNNLFSK